MWRVWNGLMGGISKQHTGGKYLTPRLIYLWEKHAWKNLSSQSASHIVNFIGFAIPCHSYFRCRSVWFGLIRHVKPIYRTTVIRVIGKFAPNRLPGLKLRSTWPTVSLHNQATIIKHINEYIWWVLFGLKPNGQARFSQVISARLYSSIMAD